MDNEERGAFFLIRLTLEVCTGPMVDAWVSEGGNPGRASLESIVSCTEPDSVVLISKDSSKDSYSKENYLMSFWGGWCLCPSGQVYGVGEPKSNCEKSVACVGGVAGDCIQGYNPKWAHKSVECDLTSTFEIYTTESRVQQLYVLKNGNTVLGIILNIWKEPHGIFFGEIDASQLNISAVMIDVTGRQNFTNGIFIARKYGVEWILKYTGQKYVTYPVWRATDKAPVKIQATQGLSVEAAELTEVAPLSDDADAVGISSISPVMNLTDKMDPTPFLAGSVIKLDPWT